ncbi:unnamed protein product [Lactuca saligna]|uniref:Ubiquitin receptor RAD23 n=1 Tax=Lactuca saligna TaxID=75948 RepID=A0AA35YLU1_LACSI|nr:unnamed protein product [Lactuca saligna]
MEGGGEANDGGRSDVVTINIRFSACEKIVVHVSLDSSVESLKSVIAKNSDVPVEEQRLINNGRLLKDDRTLRSYDLEAEHIVYLIRVYIPLASEDDTTSGSDTSSPSTTESETMSGYRYLSPSTIDFSAIPGVEPIPLPWVQNSDMSQEMMDHLITNPDAVRNIAINTPESREAIDRDPDLARIFNDPVIFRNMAESAVISEVIARVGGGGSGGGGGGGTPSHPAGTDSSAPPVDLGGPEIPGLEGMLGFTPDPIAMSQLMQSPAISQFIQRLLSNPHNMNPILNPQYREIMQNPVLTSKSQLTSPETMQEMLALHQTLSYLLGEEPITRWDAGQTSGGTGTQSQPFSGEGTSGSTPPNNNLNNVGSEEVLYASQLAQLEAMGFHDTRKNLEALTATKGNVPAAVDRLRGGQ